MDPRVELYKNAFGGRQIGGGGYIPKFYGSHRYQNGGCFGDVMRGLLRRFWPVAKQGFAGFLRAGGESMKEGATWKEALKSSIKPTIGAVLNATADQSSEEKPAAAPPPGPPIAHSESVLVGTQGGGGSGGGHQRGGSVKRRGGRAAYKKTNSRSKKSRSVLKTTYSRNHIIYNY